MQIRLFADVPLRVGGQALLSEAQRHYLKNVLRANVGAQVFLFNGKDGEFCGRIGVLDKKTAQIDVLTQTGEQEYPRSVFLYFTPLKRDCTDLLMQKAAELGVTHLCPVLTDYTAVSRINFDRAKSIVIEAAEQSRRLTVPEILPLRPLKEILANRKEEDGILFHLDETGQGKGFAQAVQAVDKKSPVSFLIGPEGGFSDEERQKLKQTPFTQGISLGKHILRAETAAIAALSGLLCLTQSE